MVNSPTTMASVRKAPLRMATRRLGGPEALRRLGQALHVHRSETGVDRPVHVRERQHDVCAHEQCGAADARVRERQGRLAVGADEAEHQDDRWHDERQQRDELDDGSCPWKAQADPERGWDQDRDADNDRDEPDDERVAERGKEQRVVEDLGVGGAERPVPQREGERSEQRQEEIQAARDEDEPPGEAPRRLAFLAGCVERLALHRLHALAESVGAAGPCVRHRNHRSDRRCSHEYASSVTPRITTIPIASA